MILNIYKEILDCMDLTAVANEFVQGNEHRLNVIFVVNCNTFLYESAMFCLTNLNWLPTPLIKTDKRPLLSNDKLDDLLLLTSQNVTLTKEKKGKKTVKCTGILNS